MQPALRIASKLESFFLDSHLRGFYRFAPAGQEIVPPRTSFDVDLVVFFAYKRLRRPHAQITHVFIRCQFLTDNAYTFMLTRQGSYEYTTVWSLAKSMLAHWGVGTEEYMVQKLDSVNHIHQGLGKQTFTFARRSRAASPALGNTRCGPGLQTRPGLGVPAPGPGKLL